jgi:hypothetical protein
MKTEMGERESVRVRSIKKNKNVKTMTAGKIKRKKEIERERNGKTKRTD